MAFFDPPHNSDVTDAFAKPFLIVHRRLEKTPDGNFRPNAAVELTQELRTSGLLRELPPEELKNLLYLFTFVTANGRCSPSVQELGAAMRVSEEKVRARMERLMRFEWQGSPLIHELRRPTGMDAYAPSVHLVGEDTVEPPFREPPTGSPVASREEVIAYSRERYTRPRQEVERQIAMLNGWPLPEEIEASVARAQTELTESLKPEDIEKKHIRQRLLRIGVLPEQADLFVVNYELDRIKRQIEWLPSRNAKSPSRYLAAAIAGDYEPPLAVRLRPGSPTEAKPAPVPQVPNPILDSVPEPVDDRLDDISL